MNVIELKFYNNYLKKNKTVLLSLPQDFIKNGKYDLYLLHDGKDLFNYNNSQLIKHLNQKNAVVIGIAAEDDIDRLNEYSSYQNQAVVEVLSVALLKNNHLINGKIGGLGTQYLQLVVNIINQIKTDYSFTVNNFNVIGCSMSGYISLEMLNFNSIKINNLYVMSPAIWFNEAILNTLKVKNFTLNKIYLWAGKKENRFFKNKIITNYEQNVLKLEKIFFEKKINLSVIIDDNGGHGWQWWVPYLLTII